MNFEDSHINLSQEHWQELQAKEEFRQKTQDLPFFLLPEYVIFDYKRQVQLTPRYLPKNLSELDLDEPLEVKTPWFATGSTTNPPDDWETHFDDGGLNNTIKKYGFLTQDDEYLDHKANLQALAETFTDAGFMESIQAAIGGMAGMIEQVLPILKQSTGFDADFLKPFLEMLRPLPQFGAAYRHYLNGDGEDRNDLPYQDFINDFPGVKSFFHAIAKVAVTQVWSELQALGIQEASWKMVSNSIPISPYDFDRKPHHKTRYQSINPDWNFALSYHWIWMSVDVGADATGFNGEITIHADATHGYNIFDSGVNSISAKTRITRTEPNRRKDFGFDLENIAKLEELGLRLESGTKNFSQPAYNVGNIAANPAWLSYTQISHQLERMNLAHQFRQSGTATLEIDWKND